MLESIIAQSPATLVADAPRLVGDGPDVVDYIEHLVTGKWLRHGTACVWVRAHQLILDVVVHFDDACESW